MIKLSTKTKLKIATALYKSVHYSRATFGGKDLVHCKRGGVNWELDLTEGIDLAIYLFGRFERSTSLALQRAIRPGMTVLDIGANVGAHALPMASWAGETGRVYAFEPTDWAFRRLQKNRSLNPSVSQSLVPVQCALTDGASEIPKAFHSSWNLMQNENPHPVHGGRLETASQAAFISLDQFIDKNAITKIDVVKMDIDGFEMQALRGGTNTIKKYRPFVLFELCPHVLKEHGTNAEDLIEFFRSIGYSFYLENGKKLNLSNREIVALAPGEGSINLIARV
jgi:FkbM family methyltransferase